MVNTAPRDRPAKHTVLRELSRELAASPETVLGALPGTRYESLVVVQGDWWYRGEYRVVKHGSGSLLTLTIVNVAQSAHWMGPVAGRRELADAPRALDELVSRF